MDATGKGGSAWEAMPAACGRRVGPNRPGLFAGGTQAETGVLMAIPLERRRGIAGCWKHGPWWGVRDSDLESRVKTSL